MEYLPTLLGPSALSSSLGALYPMTEPEHLVWLEF